jgi:hypothetical protein
MGKPFGRNEDEKSRSFYLKLLKDFGNGENTSIIVVKVMRMG